MAALLEVIALHAADAQRAEEGGADRIELLGTMTDDGMSPEPALVESVRRATTIQLRVMVRLRPGFSTDGGEVTRLKGLIHSYREAGADGMVLGYLNAYGQVDLEVIDALTDGGGWPWTFHRAIDHTLEVDKVWKQLIGLPRLDQVLTAGSPRGVEYGLDDLISRATADPRVASLIMAGGSLRPEHVPWLVRAGVRSFHIGSPARPLGSYKSYIDPGLVRTWRELIDTETRHARSRLAQR